MGSYCIDSSVTCLFPLQIYVFEVNSCWWVALWFIHFHSRIVKQWAHCLNTSQYINLIYSLLTLVMFPSFGYYYAPIIETSGSQCICMVNVISQYQTISGDINLHFCFQYMSFFCFIYSLTLGVVSALIFAKLVSIEWYGTVYVCACVRMCVLKLLIWALWF